MTFDRATLIARRTDAPEVAESLMERLARRDADPFDDRRMCIECAHLLRNGRCGEASLKRMPGLDYRFEPVRDVLQRCDHFKLAPELAPVAEPIGESA